MKKSALKIMLIGCGKIAMAAHLPILNQLRQEGLLEIIGVCDIDQNKAKLAAEKFGIPNSGTDWDELSNNIKPEAVSICLPPGPNAETATQALGLGLHIMCEKPPGRNQAQAERMTAAALARPDLVTMIAFNRRFAPLYTRAIENSRQLGRPHAFYGRFTRPSLGASPSNTAKDWITSDGSHVLDLAVATMGFPHSLAVGRRCAGSGPDNVWTVQLFSEQGTAVLLFDFTAGRRIERFEWSGPGFDVLLELPERGEWSRRGQSEQQWSALDLTHSTDFFVNYGFLDEYRHFIHAINGNEPRPQADFAYGWEFMKLVQTILDCPSGEMRPVPSPVSREGDVLPKEAESPKTAIGVAPKRPVVYILQSPAAQSKFFSVEHLSKISESCDLRLRRDDNWRPALADSDVLITGWGGVPLSPEDISTANGLKLVIAIGASVKAMSPEALFERNITLCNTADAIAQSVAEHCLLLTLAGLRRLTEVDRQVHQGGWPPLFTSGFSKKSLINWAQKNPLMNFLKPVLKPVALAMKLGPDGTGKDGGWNDLQGQVVGLIGWGHIARHFCRLLQPFNCTLMVHSNHVSEADSEAFRLHKASLGEIMGASRVISLHKGLTDQSRAMIGAQELALMQPGAVLVNTARGPLIDEVALIAHLREGRIVAALDVFHQEPLPKKHPLRRLTNVILTPHNAGTTIECNQRVGNQALTLLADFIQGRPVQGIDYDHLANMT
jgi:phosphoglycerate dehydrogenase-like enzyme/predicted dehydrogenase